MKEQNERGPGAPDERLVGRAKELFDRSVDGLDAGTRSRLNRGRHAALEHVRPGAARGPWLQWTPAAGVAVAAAVAIVVWNARPGDQVLTPPAELEDFEILLTEDSLEMLEELEFYTWIEQEAQLDEATDGNGNVG